MRTLLIYGWIALMAAYSTKQVIDKALIFKVKQTSGASFFFAHDDASFLLPDKPSSGTLPNALEKNIFKFYTYHNQKLISTSNYYKNLFFINHPTYWVIFIAKIIYPFHYFW